VRGVGEWHPPTEAEIEAERAHVTRHDRRIEREREAEAADHALRQSRYRSAITSSIDARCVSTSTRRARAAANREQPRDRHGVLTNRGAAKPPQS
jgi:hypothetical protein